MPSREEMARLTPQEKELLNKLGEVWKLFGELPCEYWDGRQPYNEHDVRHHVHALENIVAARMGFRLYWLDQLTEEHK